jgi:hypothetical protein
MKVFNIVLAVFTLVLATLLAGCGASGVPQHPATTQRASGSSAQSSSESSTQTFPDGTRVTFISVTWVMTPDNDGPAVKFTFRIVAGPDWKQNAKVQLRPGSGNERPLNYYMVTATGWFYPSYNSTGYADIGNIFTAQGGQESGEGANTLFAGDSVYASSTLATQSEPPNPQHLVVTIEMPNDQLQSRSFTVNVGPNPFGASSSGGQVSQSQEPVSQVPASPPESAIQVLQDDGFPPAVIGIPLPPNATDIAASPLDYNNEDKPQELVIVYDSPSAASTAAASEREMLANAGYTAVTVSIKDDGYAVVTRASTSDFQKLGL